MEGAGRLPIDKVNEILKLSRLSMVAYDTERKEAAIRLGIRRSTLNEIVGRLCSRMTLNDDDENKQGTRFEFTTFEPWPDVVDGATLIVDMMAAIRSHVILAPHQSLPSPCGSFTPTPSNFPITPRVFRSEPDDTMRQI